MPLEPIFRTAENRKYMVAVATTRLDRIVRWLTTTCTECDHEPIAEGTEREHGMLGDFVLIGCEGYWLINPNAVGIYNENWYDWTITK
jgi:hypothetical protein